MKPTTRLNPSRLMSLPSLFIVMISAAAFAAVTQLANAEDMPVPGDIALDEAAYNGPGCPIGSVAFSLSPDRKAITALFSNFTASTSPGAQAARAACALDLKLRVPQGWSYAIYASVVRGYANFDVSTRGRQTATYSFGAQTLMASDRTFVGPVNEDYTVTASVPLNQVIWSPCGGMRNLSVAAAVEVNGPNGLITVDSIDGEIHQTYGLSWRRCSGTEIIGPGPVTPSSNAFVRALDGFTGANDFQLAPYGAFNGGAHVAMGDINGDGYPDIIVGAGPGGGPHVRIYDGRTGGQIAGPLGSFFAFDAAFRGGVSVASGDVDGDGRDDLICGAGSGGGPHVIVYSGATGQVIRSFFAYATALVTGINVGAADVNGDGKADIITAPMRGAPAHVQVFDGATSQSIRSFFAFDPAFTGGATVAGGDVDHDGYADIIVGAGPGAGPHVKVVSGRTQQDLFSFYAYDQNFHGGVTVASTDLDRDGYAEIITGAGPGGGPHVRIISGATRLPLTGWQGSFWSLVQTARNGVWVAAMPPKAGRYDPRNMLVVGTMGAPPP